MLTAKLHAARLAGLISRRAGRGGTSLPGKLLMTLEPRAIEVLGSRLSNGSAVISATNGKTTTAAMVSAILRRGGARLVHNRQGANMAGGVASALLEAVDGQALDGDTGLFEVDEFWLPQVVEQLHPQQVLLANLFRDQLDRYGELETIADRWADVVASLRGTRLVLNADDPMIAALGDGQRRVVYFGIEDSAVALPGMQHAADAKRCRRCAAPYHYDAVFLGHLGQYHCESCGAIRPTPQVSARDVRLDGLRGARFRLTTPSGDADVALPLPGLYNVYNALGAAALALAMGATIEEIEDGLHDVSPAFGRAESVRIDGRDVLLLLIKNPAGANEVLRTLVLEPGDHELLCVLNDKTADGRDVSWIWDADFEVLAGRISRAVCSGTRAAEMALRLKYAGVHPDRLEVEPSLERAMDRAVEVAENRLIALPTYTAMLELRDLLARRGLVEGQFE